MTIEIDYRPPPVRGTLLGFQHVLVMLGGMIAVPLAVSAGLDLPVDQRTMLVQGSILVSGIGTVVQAIGVGFVGARLPIVMGTAFVFIAPMISVGESLGLQAIMGAIIVGGLAEFALSLSVWRIRRFFPPIVTGTVILIIGISLLPLGFGWAVGAGTDEFGERNTLILSGAVLLALILLHIQPLEIIRSMAILISIVVGYLVAALLGMLDLAPVGEAGWVAPPSPLAFGAPTFHLGAIVVVLIAQFASMIETIGDTVGIRSLDETEVTKRDLRGAVSVDGLASAVAPLLNGLSLTSFSQNLGVISLTRIGSRYVVAIGGGILVAFGLIPKLSAVITSMPLPVLGGAAIVMFGAVAAAGADQLRRVEMNQRNTFVFAVAVGLGVGVATVPAGAFDILPAGIRIPFESSVAVGGIAAILLDLVLPDRKIHSVSDGAGD